MATSSPAAFSASERAPLGIGLTGGIGSGKSLVAGLLAARGAALVDTDAIAHRLTAPGGAAIDEIRRAFGKDYIDRSGALDRVRTRALVFDDARAKGRLEGILHPLIRVQADADAAAVAGATPYVVFAVPLLVESGGWTGRVDRVLVVDCPVAEQIRRVVNTRDLSPALVSAIVARQASRSERIAAADDVIVNAGPPGLLEARVARLHAHYCAIAAARGAARSPARPL